MGKPAAPAELKKQAELVKELQDKKAELSEATRENNKALDTQREVLRCMASGEKMPDMFADQE